MSPLQGELEIKKGYERTLLSSLLSLPGNKGGGEEDLPSAEDRLIKSAW